MGTSLFLIALIIVCSAPFVIWWTKKPRNGWRVSNKIIGHTFSNGNVVTPGHIFPVPKIKNKK